MLRLTQKTALVHTAYIERLNASFRQGIACLVRRGRCIIKNKAKLSQWLFIKGTVYNFCQPHQTLSTKIEDISPAMAAGITKHLWSFKELLEYRVPPQLWKPKGRGRYSKEILTKLRKWRPDLIPTT